MGSWTDRYLLYMAAAGEMGYGEKVSGNFAKIDEVLGTNEDVLDAHKASHNTVENRLQMNTDLLIPIQYSMIGKVVTDYTIAPGPGSVSLAIPVGVMDASTLVGDLQILQLPFFQTMHGSLNFRTRGQITAFTLTLLCIDQNMQILSAVNISPTGSWQNVAIPKNTAGIYARSGRSDILYMSGYTISVTP